MRIIGGAYKGLVIPHYRGTVRPMMDRARESLFMVLEIRSLLRGATVADLFAGSGALSAEALSRGARAAILTDIDTAAIRHLKYALPPPIYAEKTLTIRRQRAEQCLRHATTPADLIFLDPPYRYEHQILLTETRRSLLLSAASTVIIHYRRGAPLSLPEARFTSVWRRDFGASIVELINPC